MAMVLGASRTLQLVSVAVAILLGIEASANAALAESSTKEQVRKIGSDDAAAMTERVQSGKPSPRKPMRKEADRSGNFVYGIINQIQAQSEELCARYGGPGDCLEEAEVCLTMRDTAENVVRLCLNTAPGESQGREGKMQRSRVRR
jgi:hypothetical protein